MLDIAMLYNFPEVYEKEHFNDNIHKKFYCKLNLFCVIRKTYNMETSKAISFRTTGCYYKKFFATILFKKK